MAETTLTDLVLAYRRGGEGKDQIMDRVASLVYGSYARYGFDDDDAAAEALMRYRSRIARLIDRFEDRGQSFDAYLASCLRYLAKTVRRERRRKADREEVCERAAAPGYCDPGGSFPAEDLRMEDWGTELKAEPIVAPGGRNAPLGRRPRARGGALPPPLKALPSSRLVYLALKCAWEIDEEGIRRVAQATGMDPAWLGAAVEQARRSLVSEGERYQRLIERRNSSWCRQRLLEARLAQESDPLRSRRHELSLEREKGRFARAQAELAQLRIIVPNSVVARIVGVPKGTVDSGLYYLRRRFGEDEARPGPCAPEPTEAMVLSHGTIRSHGKRP